MNYFLFRTAWEGGLFQDGPYTKKSTSYSQLFFCIPLGPSSAMSHLTISSSSFERLSKCLHTRRAYSAHLPEPRDYMERWVNQCLLSVIHLPFRFRLYTVDFLIMYSVWHCSSVMHYEIYLRFMQLQNVTHFVTYCDLNQNCDDITLALFTA